MAESYSVAKCRMIYGGSDFAVDLTPDLEAFALAGQVSTDRRRRVTGTGELGLTADAMSAGWQATATVRLSDDSKILRTKPEGILMIARADAKRVVAFDCVISTRPLSSPAEGAVTVAVTFVQKAAGNATEGALVSSGNLSASGKVGYLYDNSADTVKPVAATASVQSGDIGVAGDLSEADNS